MAFSLDEKAAAEVKSFYDANGYAVLHDFVPKAQVDELKKRLASPSVSFLQPTTRQCC